MAVAMLAWIVAIPILGGMTGVRSMTPMAVLCWFAYVGHLDVGDSWALWTTKLVTAIVFTVLAVGEFVGDKLPMTPNRTAPFPLIARIAFGSLVGAIAATGLHGSALEGALLGGLSAVAGAYLSFQLRQWLVKEKGYSDLPVALFEDGLAIGLSVLAMGVVTG